MSNPLTILSASAAILFIASCMPVVTEPAMANIWDTKRVLPEVEQDDPERDHCIEDCG